MLLRTEQERREAELLAPWAAKATQTRGRERAITPCEIRTEFQRDRDRILHCKSFRRLKHKTQMFLSPEGDHYRTRLTHTLEVSQIARTITRALNLNEDLAEAIALGHDLGHTPFGHSGERALRKVMPNGFEHNEQSLRVVDFIERDGEGLNLTWEVRDGIAHHSGPVEPQTLEGKAVHLADRIAYINHDIDDAMRAGMLRQEDLPQNCLAILGKTHGQRINTMILDIIRHSGGREAVEMSPRIGKATDELRSFMFKEVYHRSIDPAQEARAEHVMIALYEHFVAHPEALPGEMQARIGRFDLSCVVGDYVAGMTDRFAVRTYADLYIPTAWHVLDSE